MGPSEDASDTPEEAATDDASEGRELAATSVVTVVIWPSESVTVCVWTAFEGVFAEASVAPELAGSEAGCDSDEVATEGADSMVEAAPEETLVGRELAGISVVTVVTCPSERVTV